MAKVMISMPDELLVALDRAAREGHKKRSELIKDLALQFLRAPSSALPAPASAERRPNPFDEIRQYTFELKKGETAEGLIRQMRDRR